MKAIKSIFDKSYIVKAQAEAAGAKEWPQGSPANVHLSCDEATRKYRWITGPLFNEARVEDQAERALMAKRGQRLVEAFVACASAQMEAAPVVGEFSHCPSCAIHLSNGVLRDGDCVNDKPMKMDKFAYECMACGHEFGPDVADLRAADAQANAQMGPKTPRPRLSSCLSPTKKVWHIADSMPKASRKDVMAECVNQGIAYGTARTQYQAWFKASQNGGDGSARKPYEKA